MERLRHLRGLGPQLCLPVGHVHFLDCSRWGVGGKEGELRILRQLNVESGDPLDCLVNPGLAKVLPLNLSFSHCETGCMRRSRAMWGDKEPPPGYRQVGLRPLGS